MCFLIYFCFQLVIFSCQWYLSRVYLREGLPKKSSRPFGFCPNEGGGGRALPNFFVHFSQTVYIGSIWGWGGGGRETPAQIFWYIGVQKKWYKLSKLGEGGGVVEVIWTKSNRTATCFRETFPYKASQNWQFDEMVRLLFVGLNLAWKGGWVINSPRYDKKIASSA